MNPKHTNQNIPRHIPENKKRGIPAYDVYARAPYNFVPLPEKVVKVGEPPDHDIYQGNTGYIECELVTQSPLYVRGMMTQSSFEKYGDSSFDKLPPEEKEKRAQFFMLRDNEPVIPGSSLRGMMRALVEIVGYGKVQPVIDKEMLFRAVGDPASLGQYYRAQMLGPSKIPSPNNQLDYPSLQLRGGYLRVRDGRRFIQPAMRHQGESIIHVEYADANALGIQQGFQSVHQIFVLPASRKPSNRGKRGQGNLTLDIAIAPQGGVAHRDGSQPPQSGMVEAVLVVSGHMGGQHPKHWHCAIYAPDPDAKPIPIPEEMWKTYEEDRDETRGFPTRKLTQDGDPLFYLVDENEQLRFFGPTMMFRLPYQKTANDFVPEPLRRESDIDLAEAIFGYTKQHSEGKQRAYASRVFVSDAMLEMGQANVWLANDEMLTPKILSSPKPTTFQHYLVQDDAGAKNKRELNHYASPMDETVIRGHKLYWHKGDVSRQEIELEKDKDRQQLAKQLTGIKPVRAGVKFKFRVNFENLNDAELGALLWVLGLPEGHSQSLGMGKPLGMGAVKITPTLYLSQREERYRKLFEDGAWASGIASVSNQAQYKDAFEKFMLEKLDAADKGIAQSFRDVERIQMLLKLLEFPGPDKNWTRNMEIERNNGYPEPKVNEFKERPVLPDPLNIVSSNRGESKSAPKPSASPQGRGQKPPASQQTRAPHTLAAPAEKKQAAPPKPVAPTSPYKIGDTFNGTVRQVWKDGTFIIEAPKLVYPKGYARVAKEDAAGKGWQEGGAARCEVIRIGQDEKGRIVLYCKPGAKREMKK
jgi:CRISPR-associated protein (TIGR03986 family)